ncbi:hypothetical protein TVAG_189050 [Trichomonas vaginalis G3]|uniref:Uncharacterized protein n=1 Tax=Trichomonas vaginalis (strain ATCC PRA-98 / G3) TaxID=412133 RepID=A2F325_TRIV3|nr:suppressor of RPS4-RLD 1 family [Trichomonas vaginalis G3]EAY00689.1 hypothetical protein TVAG_189050 [Trichomonas vaginalis G3]KAI5513283.1 suppressor of RPS4-RLD 1 family [Trichomonas vaginalis G3]|eukprot:XP_001313618.1 hypothetical protein [Trichomonas vaginalis G3]
MSDVDLIIKGNEALNSKQYAKAVSLYEIFLLQNPGHPQTEIALENTKLALDFLSEQTDQGQNYNYKTTDSQKYNSAIKSLCIATEAIEQNPSSAECYAARGKIYEQIGLYRNAANDYQKAQRQNTTKLEYMKKLSTSALKCNELESSMAAARIAVAGGVCCFAPQAQLMWSAHRYDEAIRLLDAAVLNNEEDSLLIRGKINFACGKIDDAYNDFIEAGAPQYYTDICSLLNSEYSFPTIQQQISRESICISELINSLVKFDEKITTAPLSLDISSQIQRLWCSPNPSPNEISNAILTLSADNSQNYVAKHTNDPRASTMARLSVPIGKIILAHAPSERQASALGMACIEIRQILQKYIDDGVAVPLSSAVSCIANYIRLYDPLSPIFWRCLVPNAVQPAFLQRGGFHTEMVMIYIRVLQALKDGIGSSDEKINNAQSTEELWKILRSNICVKCKTSNAEIFMRKTKENTMEFGFVVPNTQEHWNNAMSKVHLAWTTALLSLGKPSEKLEAIRNSFNFMYEWMRAWPLTSESHTVGAILFYTLFNAASNMKLSESLPSPIMLQIEALLTGSFKDYFELVAKHFNSKLKSGSISEGMPNIADVLPSFLSRLRAIKNIMQIRSD